jgi:hypothetical protein
MTTPTDVGGRVEVEAVLLVTRQIPRNKKPDQLGANRVGFPSPL